MVFQKKLLARIFIYYQLIYSRTLCILDIFTVIEGTCVSKALHVVNAFNIFLSVIFHIIYADFFDA